MRPGAARRPAGGWAAGGGTPHDRHDEVLAAGARRVVVVRAITEASDPQDAAARLRAGLDAAATA